VSALHLAFDVGTTGTKAALLTPDGQLVETAYRGYDTVRGARAEAEQRAQDWFRAVVESSRELGDLSRVEAIVVTGQMQNLTLVDQENVPLRPTLLYSDTRATREADELNDAVGQLRLQQLTGNEQDAGSLLAKLLWLKRNEPETLARAKTLYLGAADYVVAELTGGRMSDTTTASTTGLMDLAARRPLPEAVLGTLGLERVLGLLPDFVPGGTRAGGLTPRAATLLELKAGLPVHLGPGDAGAATVGAGSGEPGRAYGYVGTSGWVGFSAHERADPASGTFTLAHPRPDTFIQVAPLLTAGGNLQWIHELFTRDPSEGGADANFDEMVDQALQRAPGQILYLPYLNGERSPVRDSAARGAFVGLSSGTKQADLCRAVLEGVVYSYRHALEALLPGGSEELILTGGGTQTPAWNKLFATVTGLPIKIIGEPESVGVKGAHHCLRVAEGAVATYSMKVHAHTFTADTLLRNYYDRMFSLYKELYPSLSETFSALAQLKV
jgi:xylulokinase